MFGRPGDSPARVQTRTLFDSTEWLSQCVCTRLASCRSTRLDRILFWDNANQCTILSSTLWLMSRLIGPRCGCAITMNDPSDGSIARSAELRSFVFLPFYHPRSTNSRELLPRVWKCPRTRSTTDRERNSRIPARINIINNILSNSTRRNFKSTRSSPNSFIFFA